MHGNVTSQPGLLMLTLVVRPYATSYLGLHWSGGVKWLKLDYNIAV